MEDIGQLEVPGGVGSTWENRKNHPVVHVAYEDASATPIGEIADCLRSRIEYAATSRGAEIRFPWGDEPPGEGKAKCNIWEGIFPTFNHAKDGYIGTAPATTYEPNELGLWKMGAMFGVCEDWYTPTTYVSEDACMNGSIRETSKIV